MAVLYLVAWQDTAKPSTHLNPVVVEVCQALTLRDLIAGPSML